jgi:hypothetical protein
MMESLTDLKVLLTIISISALYGILTKEKQLEIGELLLVALIGH